MLHTRSWDDCEADAPKFGGKRVNCGCDRPAPQQFLAKDPVTIIGAVRPGDAFEHPEDALAEEDVHFYYNAKGIPVNRVPRKS